MYSSRTCVWFPKKSDSFCAMVSQSTTNQCLKFQYSCHPAGCSSPVFSVLWRLFTVHPGPPQTGHAHLQSRQFLTFTPSAHTHSTQRFQLVSNNWSVSHAPCAFLNWHYVRESVYFPISTVRSAGDRTVPPSHHTTQCSEPPFSESV